MKLFKLQMEKKVGKRTEDEQQQKQMTYIFHITHRNKKKLKQSLSGKSLMILIAGYKSVTAVSRQY